MQNFRNLRHIGGQQFAEVDEKKRPWSRTETRRIWKDGGYGWKYLDTGELCPRDIAFALEQRYLFERRLDHARRLSSR